MLNRIFSHIKNQHITIGQWLAGFVGIVAIRFILEAFSSPARSGVIPTDLAVVAHYTLFFAAVLIGLMVLIQFFTKQRGETIASLGLFGLLAIWIAPIVDLATTRGVGRSLEYLQGYNLEEIVINYFTFLLPGFFQGDVVGLRVEVFIILCGIGAFVWISRKKVFPVVVAVIFSYSLVFVAGSLPGIMYLLSNTQPQPGMVPADGFYQFVEHAVTESNIAHNTLRDTLSFSSYENRLGGGFNKIMAQAFYLLTFFAAFIWFWNTQRIKILAVFKNARPERVVFYVTFLVLGMGFAYFSGGKLFFASWVDWMSAFVLALSVGSAWMYAVHMNDIADVGIDSISNTKRPLVQKSLTALEMRESGYLWLFAALVGSFVVGYFSFFMTVIFLATSHIYSTPPLRLRMVPVLASFLISLAVLSVVLSGYFFVSSDKMLSTFPFFVAVGIVVMFTLGVNVRDIKDIEGDRAEGVNTLPVLFKEHGVRLVALLFSVSFLLAPLFLSFSLLYVVALPTAIVGYLIVVHKPYKEFYIFILYFVFLFLAALLFILR